jgi:hypothetical protein
MIWGCIVFLTKDLQEQEQKKPILTKRMIYPLLLQINFSHGASNRL